MSDSDFVDVLSDAFSWDLELVDASTSEGQQRINHVVSEGKGRGGVRRCTRDFWQRYQAAIAHREGLQAEFDTFPPYVVEWRAHLYLGDAPFSQIVVRPKGDAGAILLPRI